MQFLLTGLAYVLAWVGSSLIRHLIVALGVGFVTFVGVNELYEWAQDYIVSNLTSVPTNVLTILKLLKVGTAISIIFSGISTRLTMHVMGTALHFGRWKP